MALVALFALYGCDNLVRFNYTHYNCEKNRLGIDSFDVQNRSGHIRGLITRGKDTVEIPTSRANGYIYLGDDSFSIELNEDTGATVVISEGKYQSLRCEKHDSFSM